MFKQVSKYWWCQGLGWMAYFLMTIYNFSTFGTIKYIEIFNLFIFIIFGILSTHLFRNILKRYNWLSYSFEKQVWLFFICVISSGVIIRFGVLLVTNLFRYPSQKKALSSETTVLELLGTSLLMVVWWLIYFIWHYVDRNRKAQVDQLKLESTVKELELKTIKAQMNPHFIFNALNSIRALVDENPQRARAAITELSNILRNSMQVEKGETVPLEHELNIVKDYLALENIRFEERLHVTYDIDPDTLELPVPPMMLQTLVENAIKHGISRSVNGGTIHISSHVVGVLHEIQIENTGQMLEEVGEHGFGLQSTRQRLNVLFGHKASFEIHNKDKEVVAAKVVMPLI